MWTQKPISSYSAGHSRRRPLFRGVQVFPRSVVSNRLKPWTMIQKRSASSGWGMIADRPRWPGGCCAGSFQASRPCWPSSVVSEREGLAAVGALEQARRLGADEQTAVHGHHRRDLRELEPASPSSPSLFAVAEALARVLPRLAEVGAPPDRRAVPLARRGGVDRPRLGVVVGLVDGPALAERPAHAPVARGRRSRARTAPSAYRRATGSWASSHLRFRRSSSIRPGCSGKVIGGARPRS